MSDTNKVDSKICVFKILFLIFLLHMDKIKIIKKIKLLLTGDKGIKKCKVKAMKDINIMPKIIF